MAVKHIDAHPTKDRSITVWRNGTASPLDSEYGSNAPPPLASEAQVNRSAVQITAQKEREQLLANGRDGVQFPAGISDVINRRPGAKADLGNGSVILTLPDRTNVLVTPEQFQEDQSRMERQAEQIAELQQQVSDMLAQQEELAVRHVTVAKVLELTRKGATATLTAAVLLNHTQAATLVLDLPVDALKQAIAAKKAGG